MTETERRGPSPKRADPKDILKQPNNRILREQPDGTFIVEYLEFSGCHAHGATLAAAKARLEEVALDWLAVRLAQGEKIPAPASEADLERWRHGF